METPDPRTQFASWCVQPENHEFVSRGLSVGVVEKKE